MGIFLLVLSVSGACEVDQTMKEFERCMVIASFSQLLEKTVTNLLEIKNSLACLVKAALIGQFLDNFAGGRGSLEESTQGFPPPEAVTEKNQG